MKVLRILLLVAVVATGLAFMTTQPTPAAAQECLNLSGNGDEGNHLGPFALTAGTTINVAITTGTEPPVEAQIAPQQTPSGGTMIIIYVDGVEEVYSLQYALPHTVSYTLPHDSNNIVIFVDWEYEDDPANAYTITSTGCTPGCSPYMPEQAVVGQFVGNAEIYWMPGEKINPEVILEAGKTYYVAGQDATGMYRQVLVSCDWVWVRAETIGPNYDEVWNGTPLPTTIVE